MISIPLYVTDQTPCGYLDKRHSRSAFVHPSFSLDTDAYSQLIEQGFRRSGDQVYKPFCPTCSECIPTRVAIDDFMPSKSQKRCIKKNKLTTTLVQPAHFKQSHYEMYMRYQKSRHQVGGMAESTKEDYIDFLASQWCDTLFVEFFADEKCIAVATIDQFDNALSAVYTFFEPEYAHLSLGTYAILWQIEYAKKQEIEFLYLGFWIKNCQKMSYKNQFQPLQGLIDKQWKEVSSNKALTLSDA